MLAACRSYAQIRIWATGYTENTRSQRRCHICSRLRIHRADRPGSRTALQHVRLQGDYRGSMNALPLCRGAGPAGLTADY